MPRFVIVKGAGRYVAEVLEFAGAGVSISETPGRIVATISGGGGGTDHATLSHLAWTSSAHAGTASRLAYFGAGGAAAELSVGSGLVVSGSALTVDTGVIATVASLAGYVPTSRQVATTGPLQGGGALSADRTISITQADATHDGYLSQGDWAAFNAKVSTSRTISTTAPLAGGGDLSADRTLSLSGWSGTTDGQPLYRSGTAVASASVASPLTWSAGALGIQTASGSQAGALSSADWTTFNSKVGTSRTIATTAPLTGGGNLSADRTIAIPAATSIVDGYLKAMDWATFNGKEPAISAGTTAQYWRGDKSWQTLDKSAVGLGSVENTALSTWAGTTNVITLGTVTTGTWRGTTIGVGYGGTGIASYTAGDLLYASGSTTLAKIAIGASSSFLGSNGSIPGWRSASQVRSDLSLVVGTNVQAWDADLDALAAISSNGILARTGAGTAAARTLQAGSDQVKITNPDGVSGDPSVDVEPGYLSAAYHWFGMATEGVGLNGFNCATFANSTSYTSAGTNNLPEAQIAASTVQTVGVRTNATICTLSQGLEHRCSFVTGSNKTTVRWRIGLAVAASIGTNLKPGSAVAMLVFDPDSGQANATTNWYLLVYDGSSAGGTYVDTGATCSTSTAYEARLIVSSSSVSCYVRTAGGSWSTVATASSNLPASGTAMNFCCFLTPTAAVSRALNFRKWSAWKAY